MWVAKEIQLTKGKVAIVDDDMFDYLSQWRWYYHKNGYALRNQRVYGENRKYCIRMHRLIAGAPKGFDVDHINGNKLDNRRDNLRVATRSENNYNKGTQVNNTSGYKGVCWSKQRKKWRSRIVVEGREMHLGFFHCKHEAAEAYNKAALNYHGEFAQINDIQKGGIG
jgi:hypothetical protein